MVVVYADTSLTRQKLTLKKLQFVIARIARHILALPFGVVVGVVDGTSFSYKQGNLKTYNKIAESGTPQEH